MTSGIQVKDEAFRHNRTESVSLKVRVQRLLKRYAPLPFYLLTYSRTSSKIRSTVNCKSLFRDFLAQSSGPCLQIAVKGEIGRKFGDNWIAVDRYDHSAVIDRHDDIHALGFPDGHFNAVVCWSVLEHVPEPQLAIAEMRRVLKPGGAIWVQVPFLFPYHADPYDYWRVTPPGLRKWMGDFEEIACGGDYWARTTIISGSFFWGRKPAPLDR